MTTKTPQALVSMGLSLLLIALEPVTVMASTAAPGESASRDASPTSTPQSQPDSAPKKGPAENPKASAPPQGGEVGPVSQDKQMTSADAAQAAPGAAAQVSDQPKVSATVEEALEAGDLTTARKLAVDHRRQHPDDPKAWRTEAQVHTRLGDLQSAIAAWQGSLKALPADAEAERREAEAAITDLRLRARGAVPGEPESTHRDDFDQQRAAAAAPVAAEAKPTKPQPAAAPKERDRVTSKWYFWVTLLAIAASAGAVTGIAIRAATRDEDDAVSIGAVGAGSPALVRF